LNTPAPKFLEVYPNPSKDFVILGYRFDKETAGTIEIRDVTGQTMQSIPFAGIQDQVTVMTRTWTTGIYMISLVIDGTVKETVKFTLVN
nr:T9SS type A sorting domain-containing protein [Bacteroidota bacterium]